MDTTTLLLIAVVVALLLLLAVMALVRAVRRRGKGPYGLIGREDNHNYPNKR